MKNIKPIIVFAAIIIGSFNLMGQGVNTLPFDETTGSPKATIDALSWIQGYWKGEAFGGLTEEIWSAPLGGTIMGSFRVVTDDKVTFYELETISEQNETLILRLKHFGPKLIGWEEKGVTVDFRLVKVLENKVYFEGFTFERISDNEINSYVIIDGEETKFNFHKYSN